MAEVVWTDEARRCLQAIYDFIAEDNEPAAYRLAVALHHRAEVLATFPEIGHRYADYPDVRVLLYGHYRLAYRVLRDRQVQILGVFHSAMEIERYFKP
ncbi:MAG TPA: type II toxin-antitoxin system RelE/ParE family toxin [Vicinamibacterales bacterium]|nr:type II toxin-antitoxin system RelE/ParE family toxin [Vicinamibacterales bacterium]